MAEQKLTIQGVMADPKFKSAKPEVQKALLLQYFPDDFEPADIPDTTTSSSSLPPILSQGGKPSTIGPVNSFDNELRSFTPKLPGGLEGNTVSLPSNRTAAKELPTIGAMLATAFLGPGAGVAVRTGMAGLGGVLGSGVEQGAEALSDAPPSSPDHPMVRAAKSGGKEAAGEGLFGTLFSKAGQYFKSTLPSTPEELAKEAALEKAGLYLKPGEIKPPLMREDKIGKQAKEYAENLITKEFGDASDPTSVGRAIYEANAQASRIAHDLSGARFEALNDVPVKLTASDIADIPASMLPEEITKKFGKVKAAEEAVQALKATKDPGPFHSIELAEAEAALKEAGKAVQEVSFNSVRELGTALREAAKMPPASALMVNTNKGLMKLRAKNVTELLNRATAAVGRDAEWKEARVLHKAVGDLFERGLGSEINRTGVKDPQRIVSLITADDRTAVESIQKIFAYAEQAGDQAQKDIAAGARRAFEREFLDQKILSQPIEKWHAQIEKSIGKDTWDALFAQNPAVGSNIAKIASAMPNLAINPDVGLDIAALIGKQGKTGLSYQNLKGLMREFLVWASPSSRNTRKLVTALEQVGSKGPNYLRGIKSLEALASEMEAEKPPALLQQPEVQPIPDFPMPPNPNPVPFRPGD